MRVAYIILAHADALALHRLISVIDPKKRDIFVHIDRKAQDTGFFDLAKNKNVKKIEKIFDIYWGHFSLLEATMYMLQSAMDVHYFDYFHVISGADYPIRPLDDFEAFLERGDRKSYVHVVSDLPDPECEKRIYSPYLIQNRDRLSVIFQKILFGAARSSALFRRRPPPGLVFKRGADWFTFPHHVVAWLLDQWLENATRTYFQRVFIPGELFFPTMVLNSPYSEEHAGDPIRYTKWTERPSPEILVEKDLHKMIASSAFFARKVSSSKSGRLLDEVDRLFHMRVVQPPSPVCPQVIG